MKVYIVIVEAIKGDMWVIDEIKSVHLTKEEAIKNIETDHETYRMMEIT